jgi:hypothetical protein
MSISGCVFFICTEVGGGPGTAVTRAVSFFGPTVVSEAGRWAAGVAGAEGLEFGAPGGTNKGGWRAFAIEGGAWVTAGAAAVLAGGRVGKVILTVSRGCGDLAPGAGVGSVRTLSFLASV